MGTQDFDPDAPGEYAGYPRNVQNRRAPTGRTTPKTTAELAQEMRREGLREAAGKPADPHRRERRER